MGGHVSRDIWPLGEEIPEGHFSIDGQNWTAQNTSAYSVTPVEYVVITGEDIWKNHVKERHIGCIAKIEVSYDNAANPTVYYAVMPFRPRQANDFVGKMRGIIPIIKGGWVYINSELPL